MVTIFISLIINYSPYIPIGSLYYEQHIEYEKQIEKENSKKGLMLVGVIFCIGLGIEYIKAKKK